MPSNVDLAETRACPSLAARRRALDAALPAWKEARDRLDHPT